MAREVVSFVEDVRWAAGTPPHRSNDMSVETWSSINESNGETTIVTPLVMTAGS